MKPAFSDIPKLTVSNHCYTVAVTWDYLIEDVNRYITKYGLQLNPDFQRGNIWTREQQIAFVEFKLRGGSASDNILMNHKGWSSDYKGDMVLVDGLQRLTAVMEFLNDEIPAFGHFRNEYTDQHYLGSLFFNFIVNTLQTRKQVLNWYVELNSGGTVHTESEINRVKQLIQEEG